MYGSWVRVPARSQIYNLNEIKSPQTRCLRAFLFHYIISVNCYIIGSCISQNGFQINTEFFCLFITIYFESGENAQYFLPQTYPKKTCRGLPSLLQSSAINSSPPGNATKMNFPSGEKLTEDILPKSTSSSIGFLTCDFPDYHLAT